MTSITIRTVNNGFPIASPDLLTIRETHAQACAAPASVPYARCVQTTLERSAVTGPRVGTWIPLVAFVALIAVAHEWGERLTRSGRELKVDVPPLHAVADFRIGTAHVVTVSVGVALAVALPRLARSAPWRPAVAGAGVAATVWTIAVNATRGTEGFVQGLDNRHEYLADVGSISSPLSFLRHFIDRFDTYATHTQGHPPGFPIVLWTLDWIGLGGAGWVAVLCILSGAVAVTAVILCLRDVAGEQAARAALPFVAIAPTALWVGSSADAFFAALGACAVAGIARGSVRPSGVRASVFGGVCLGLTMLCTYGAILLLAIPGAVALRARRAAPLALSAIAAGSVVLVAYAAGFDYLDGLRNTRRAYFNGVASVRPYSYALVANVALLAIAAGPATFVGLSRLRVRGVRGAPLVAGALTAVAVANVSGMSRLEVERIWLPFTIWLLPAAALAARGATMERRWLMLQIAWAIALQTVVRTGW